MSDTMIVSAVGLIVGIIAIVTPIIKLNANVVKLTTLVEQLEKIVNDKTDELARRITEHGHEIDDIRTQQADHEARIKHLEK